ncbi:hypothetical protein BH18VER1_BH18VER1_08400 [soil metagenome]
MADTPPQILDPAATDKTVENARNGAGKRRDPNQPSAVIGIGASAGGIAVLQQFFGDMSPESGLAFVVVMHLAPDHESNLHKILQNHTRMPVTQVNEPVRVQPNNVYVIAPNKQLTFTDGTLELIEPRNAAARRVTIDLFFRTLAQSYGQRAVCIVLSGTDSDGVIGLKHIRAQGGVTIAQDPNEAEHDSMPVTAISTGMVDWVLPVAQMAPKLLEFVRNENAMQLPPEIPEAAEPDAKVQDAPGGETVSNQTRSSADESALMEVLAYLRRNTGHDFAHYKRAIILRRIARRMQVNSIETIPQYLEFLRRHGAETRALLQDFLIGVTHFFRDQASFAALEAHIPQLFAGKEKDDHVRVWVAGCATGEEAYTIAMLLCEHAARLETPPTIQIFASDIDDDSIEDARDGLYPATIEADVLPGRLKEFFARDHGRYRVRKQLREKVLFASHNVLRDAPFSRMDLICCRNLLIYLNPIAQEQVFDIFHFALRAGGLLFVGGSESASTARPLFAPVDPKHPIYVRQSTPRPGWKIPMNPARAPEPGTRGNRAMRPRNLPPLQRTGVEEASGQTIEARHAAEGRRELLFGELHMKLLEQYGPPSLVVNDSYDIVHISENAGRYLQFSSGEPSANLLAVANPVLRVELRAALFRASQGSETVRGAPQKLEIDGNAEVIIPSVRAIRSPNAAQGFYLVVFEPEAQTSAGAAQPVQHDSVTSELEAEIQALKMQLSTAVEQYEAANEELKASNEELQAMNEEMRSTGEELETSKEELQSTNEELLTMNTELKSNVEELSRTNADLNNLMASTDIGTVFLDRQLRIQRFTPSAQKIFNMIPADMGRPLSDITNKLSGADLIPDSEQVLENLHTIEREVRVGVSNWYMTRIAPYRTNDRIAGVVATFIDITRRKRAEEELRASEERYRSLFNTMDEAFYVMEMLFDENGKPQDYRFLETNPAFEKLTGLRNVVGKTVREVLPQIEEHWVQEYGQVALTGQSMRISGDVAGLGGRWYDGYGFRVGGDGSRCVAVVFSEITERKRWEEQLRAREEQFRTLANTVPQLIWTNDANGEANYFNDRWYEYSGLSYEESAGPGWQAIVHPDDAAASIAEWQRCFARNEAFESEFRLRRKDGVYRWQIARNVPFRDATGKVTSWFGSTTDVEDFKRADEALRQSEERFRLLVEGAPDHAMFLMDEEGTITYWSTGAETVFGWQAEEAVGKKTELVFTPEDRAKREHVKEMETAKNDECATDRRWHLRKDGALIWIDGVMRRLDNPDGSLRGFAKIARDATEMRRAEDQLREGHDQLEERVRHRTMELQAMNETLEDEMTRRQRLEREILEVTERERARISQDLHDSLCQELTATAFLLKSRAKTLGRDDPEAGEALHEGAAMVNKNAGLARDLARGLHPLELGEGGLIAALRELAARTTDGVTCRCECPRSLRVPTQNVAVNLYRIAQEAVMNAIKHAKPTEVLICIERSSDEIVLSICDDGTPRKGKKKPDGLGLQMMRYRASVSGGRLTVETKRDGKGTKVTCRVPAKA